STLSRRAFTVGQARSLPNLEPARASACPTIFLAAQQSVSILPPKTTAPTAMAIVTPRNFATPSIFPTPDRIQFVRVPSRFPHSSRWPNRTRQIPPPRSQSPSRALVQSPRQREFA